MGVFTGTHRDFWTHWYDQLDRNQENHANFLKIQSTLFAVAFDDFEVGSKKNVDAFARNDPFSLKRYRKRVSCIQWSKPMV